MCSRQFPILLEEYQGQHLLFIDNYNSLAYFYCLSVVQDE
jgi:hypothetical protein